MPLACVRGSQPEPPSPTARWGRSPNFNSTSISKSPLRPIASIRLQRDDILKRHEILPHSCHHLLHWVLDLGTCIGKRLLLPPSLNLLLFFVINLMSLALDFSSSQSKFHLICEWPVQIWASNKIIKEERSFMGKWDLGSLITSSAFYRNPVRCRVVWITLRLQQPGLSSNFENNSSLLSLDENPFAEHSRRASFGGLLESEPCIHAKRIIEQHNMVVIAEIRLPEARVGTAMYFNFPKPARTQRMSFRLLGDVEAFSDDPLNETILILDLCHWQQDCLYQIELSCFTKLIHTNLNGHASWLFIQVSGNAELIRMSPDCVLDVQNLSLICEFWCLVEYHSCQTKPLGMKMMKNSPFT
ncbi:hypothetical protein RJ641_004546 [Dillenia turbinata]|uniref:SAC9 second GBDL domain-containing protein n=1 Tax=Dillenia turbinata TaxID=194707 RepID=A0AAN8ZA71_9MAGN